MLLKKVFCICKEKQSRLHNRLFGNNTTVIPLTQVQLKLSSKSFYCFRRIKIFGEVDQLSATLANNQCIFVYKGGRFRAQSSAFPTDSP